MKRLKLFRNFIFLILFTPLFLFADMQGKSKVEAKQSAKSQKSDNWYQEYLDFHKPVNGYANSSDKKNVISREEATKIICDIFRKES